MKKDIVNEQNKKDDLGGKVMDKKKKNVIIVNGVRHEISEKKISFEDVIELAFGQYDSAEIVAYTVTYSYKHGHHNDKGILTAGDSVKIKEGMVFNATKTTRS